jgi:hypothetical protein
MRSHHAFLFCAAIILMPVTGFCDSAQVALRDPSQTIQSPPLDGQVSASLPAKTFRGFFGYLEFDFDPAEPVPGFGPLAPSTREISQIVGWSARNDRR